MATRTVSNAGGAWNSTATWVGGVVPVVGDDVNFTSTSGPLTVNVSTANLIGINFTNYVNTITFNQPINTNGTVNLGTGGYIQAGTSGLIINGATTIIGSTTWSRTLTTTGTTYIITLSNSLNVTGQVTFSHTGTLTFSVGVNTFNPTGDILISNGTTTLPNNVNIVNLNITPSTTSQPIFNTNTINISGNLTLSSSVSGMFLGGTTNLVLTGTGTWSHSGTAMQLRNNLTINTSGTITISGIVYYNTGTLTYTSGTVTTTSSTLNIGTSATLNTNGIPWNNITITATSTLTLSSNLSWSGTFSITGGNTTFAGVGVMSGAALTITTANGTVTLNNDITCTGLVTLGTAGTSVTLNSSGGTRTIITSGGITNATTSALIICNINIKVTGGTITSSGNVATGGYYQINTGYQFEIDGNVTFSSTGAFYIYGGVTTGTGGTFKYTSGTVTTTGSSVYIHSIYVNSGSITWNNVWILSGGATISVLQSDMIVNGLLTLGYLTTGFTINNDGTTRTIIANNGITMSGSTSVVLGTANIRVTGGTITGVSSVQLRNNLELAGNITFANGVTFSYNTGTLLYTSGTITTTNSTIAIGGSTTLNTSGIPWVNVIINAVSTITLSSNLTWSGTFSISSNTTFAGVGVMSGVTLTITTGTITLNNDITCTGLVTLGTAGGSVTLNSSGGTRTIITSGGITNATTSTFITFNINIRITGGVITSSGSLSGGYYQFNTGYQFEIAGNVTFSTSIFYIYGGVSTGTGGTFKYTSGTVTTAGSSIWIQAVFFNSGSINWNNVWFISGSASTTVLQSDVIVNGLLTLGYTTAGYTINNDGTTRTIIANNGITMSGSSSIVLGTANIRATSGTITGVSSVQLRNNLELAGNITFANGVTFNYNTGTLLYTSGTITTTNSTLAIFTSTTLNTSGITWNNITYSGTTATITLSSNLVFIGTFTIIGSSTTTVTFAGVGIINSLTGTLQLTVSGGNLTITTSATHNILNYYFNAGGFAINGSGTWNVYGSLIRNGTGNGRSATGTINFVGTGSVLFNGGSTGAFVGIWNINPSGTLTFGSVTFPTVYYEQSTINYIGGTVDASNCTLAIGFTITSVTTTLNTTSSVVWGNITINGANTISLSSTLNISGNLTTQSGAITINGLVNLNVGGNLTINSATSGTTPITLNGAGAQTWSHGSAVYLSNSLRISKPSGTLTLGANVYYNTGTLLYTAGVVNTTTNNSTLNINASTTLDTTGINWNNLTTSGTTLTITLSSNLTVNNTLTFAHTGTLTFSLGIYTLNFSNNLVVRSGTTTLPNNFNVVNATLIDSTASAVLNGFTINISGNLTTSSTGSCSGTTNLILNGTGIWSNSSTGIIQNNLTINTSGTITISGTVYYGTGTLLYTAGTVTTTGSTLAIASSTTLDTDRGATKIIWNNLTTSGTTLTITLSSDLTVTNTLTFAHSGTLTFTLGLFSLNFANDLVVRSGTTTLPRIFNVVNATLINSTTSAVLNGFTINISGNLTTTSTGICSGTTNLVLTGTGTWSNSSTGQIRNNLTINAVTITISGTVYYNTGTLTYTAGTVNTTGSTLAIGASTTLNTNGIIWNVISWSGGTITLSSILTAIGLITASHNFPVINGSDLYANAGFNFTASNFQPNFSFISGTSTIRFEGSGSWTSPSFGTFRNNVIINPTGNFSINTSYITGTITYSNSNGGLVTSASVTLGYYNSLSGAGGPRSTTFNTNDMRWDYIYVMDYTNGGQPGTVITCTSNLNVNLLGFQNIGASTNINIGFSLGTGVDIINLGNLYINGRITLNLPKDIVTDTLQFDTGIWWRVNNFSIRVKRLLTIGSIAGTTSIDGTTKVIMMDDTTYQRTDSNTNPLLLNMEFQGGITFRATSAPLLTYGGSSITYTGSKYSTAKGTLLLSTNATLLNFDKLGFQNLIATSGINLTMNQFTSGSPNFKSNISASSTSNYTITFIDRTEKFAKFVRVSRATLVNPGQLTVITDKLNQGNNVGIKYAPNQLANGFAKNTPSTQNTLSYGVGGILTDPIFN